MVLNWDLLWVDEHGFGAGVASKGVACVALVELFVFSEGQGRASNMQA